VVPIFTVGLAHEGSFGRFMLQIPLICTGVVGEYFTWVWLCCGCFSVYCVFFTSHTRTHLVFDSTSFFSEASVL